MKIQQIKARIVSNKEVKANFWLLEFVSSSIAKAAQPGQFVNVKVASGWAPLLRRPLSIHKIKNGKVQLFYEALGLATEILTQRRPKEFLDIIGPLGSGFNYQKSVVKSGKTKNILIAGGMGVAPLVFLAEKIKMHKPLVLIGAQSANKVLCAQEFRNFGCQVKIATNDGSLGFGGQVTDLLKINLTLENSVNLFACGPQPMLQAVAQIATAKNINCELSLEAHMACGIGACLGCVVMTKSGYKRVCQDGPVFSSKELTWEKR